MRRTTMCKTDADAYLKVVCHACHSWLKIISGGMGKAAAWGDMFFPSVGGIERVERDSDYLGSSKSAHYSPRYGKYRVE